MLHYTITHTVWNANPAHGDEHIVFRNDATEAIAFATSIRSELLAMGVAPEFIDIRTEVEVRIGETEITGSDNQAIAIALIEAYEAGNPWLRPLHSAVAPDGNGKYLLAWHGVYAPTPNSNPGAWAHIDWAHAESDNMEAFFNKAGIAYPCVDRRIAARAEAKQRAIARMEAPLFDAERELQAAEDAVHKLQAQLDAARAALDAKRVSIARLRADTAAHLADLNNH